MRNINQELAKLQHQKIEKPFDFSNVGHVGVLGNISSEFSPDSVTGLICWLKADAGITKDGSDLVSNWADQSGNSNDVAQATGSKQPLWVDSVYNSLPTVRFDGVDNSLRKATWSGGEESQANTIFIVCKFSTINDSWVFDGGTTSKKNGMQRSGTGTYRPYAGTLAGTVSVNTAFSYYTVIYNTTSSSIRRNGSSVETGLSIGTQEANGLTLGSLQTEASGYSDPDISEVLFYDSEITGDDLTNIESYLATRWDL